MDDSGERISYLVSHEGIRLRQKLRRDKLGLIGFVFSSRSARVLLITLCSNRCCGDFFVLGIGFVLRNKGGYL